MKPSRIVSLLSSATEIACALGLEESLVAVSHECDFPPSVRSRPKATVSFVDSLCDSASIDEQVKARLGIGLPLYGLDEELIRELAPDLILTQDQCDVCAIQLDVVKHLVNSFPELADTEVLALNPNSLDQVFADIIRVAKAAGRDDVGAALVDSLQARCRAVSDATEAAGARPSVLCVEWTSPLMAAGNWTPELIGMAGGACGLAAPRVHSRYVAWSEIRQFDPEVLLIAPCGFDLERSLREAETLRRLEGWRDLRAVRDERVFTLDGNAYLNRSGPRLVDSLELVARLLHPAHFPSVAETLAQGIAWSRLSSC